MNKLSDKEIQELIREAGERFTLSAGEKTALRFELLDVIKSGEYRTKEYRLPRLATRDSSLATTPSSSHIINQRRLTMPFIPIIIAAVLALGGGTAAMANTAAPGDSLYAVDQWMERIQERMTSNTEGKARLMSRFSEERLAELAKIRQTDSAQLETKLKERWEERHQEAITRLSESIAKINEVQARFEEKLSTATEEAQKTAYQKVITHLKEVEARRQTRLETVESQPYSGTGNPIRQRIQQWTQENKQEMEQIRNEIRNEFGEGAMGVGQGNGVQTQTQTGNQTQNQNRNGQTNTVTNSTTTSSKNPVQVALEFLIPRDAEGNIRPDLVDSDKDGIPDKWDKYPNWPIHTM